MESPQEIKVRLEEREQNRREIKENGSIVAGAGRKRLFCLSVIGQIEGHYLLDSTQKSTKYEHVMPQLVAVEEDPEIYGVLILLNTVGGDVEAGLAMAELIAGMTKPTASLVLGGGHSIGVPLAVAADASFIVPSATMTVHPVRSGGLVINAPQSFDYFQKMQARIVRFVCARSKISEKRFQELMMAPDELATDIGTILDGEQAVKEGLIGSVGTLDAALAYLQHASQMPKRKNPKKRGKND